jgi:hypothetical protein
MSIASKRIFNITGIVVLILGAVILAASFIAHTKLEEKIREELLAAGFHTKSVSISLFKRSVELDSVQYDAPPGTTAKNPHYLFIQKVKVSGVHLYSLLKKKEILIDQVILAQGSVRYNKNFKTRKDSSATTDPENTFNRIRVNYLSVTALDAAVMDDTLTESSGTINDFEAGQLNLSFRPDTTYSIGWIEAHLENLQQSKKAALHSFAVSKIDYTSKDGHLEADSFRIIPAYNKVDFARIAKIQKTRLDIVVPKIICEGIKQARLFADSTLEITRIYIPKPLVHAYRDKRYPFVRDWIMPLPTEGIRRLPFKLRIDSIVIRQADIAYEEFSEKGLESTGTITFNRLNASFAGLSTELKQPDANSFCTLVADCKVMDNGSLHATFKLPLNRTVNYEAYGSLRNMNLTSLNPALGNLTRIEIKAGTLNDLRFNFSYNDDVSKGEVLINYSDLDLTALKKEKVREENRILSAVINAIVRSDKDKSVDKSKRTGVIDIERDKKRFVFQFWWKSLLDGLQSTFTDNGKNRKTRDGSSK